MMLKIIRNTKYYNGNFNWHILTSICYVILFYYIDIVFQRVLSQLSLGTLLPIWQTVDQQLRCCSSWWSSWCCYPWKNSAKLCWNILSLQNHSRNEIPIFLKIPGKINFHVWNQNWFITMWKMKRLHFIHLLFEIR